MAALKNKFWLEFVILTLSGAFWFAASPASLARESSAAELIEDALPSKMTMEKAGKPDFLSAVCTAVRKNRTAASAITRAAASARGEYAPDIIATVLRCARKVDCEDVGAMVKAAISAQPRAATAISDAAMARAPNCEESIEAAARAAKNEDDRAPRNAPQASPSLSPGAGTDEGFDPHEQLVLVCDGGTQRAIRQSLLADFLRSHSEAKIGSCPPTPTPSPLPSRAPSPPAARP